MLSLNNDQPLSFGMCCEEQLERPSDSLLHFSAMPSVAKICSSLVAGLVLML